MNMVRITFILFIFSLPIHAEKLDSLNHWGYTFHLMPGKIVAIDKYSAKWIKKTPNFSIAAELEYSALRSDSDLFAEDYGYPLINLGMRYTLNNEVRLHRDPDPDWGQAQPVNYFSRLGNTFSLYGRFYRPVYRRKKWETAYSFSLGLGYSKDIYNKLNNIDNELIGSHISIYFGSGIHETYYFDQNWGVRAGIELIHHSNGALYRPNKGSNSIGTSIGMVYEPFYYELVNKGKKRWKNEVDKYLYLNFSAGFGAKTMLEDWLETQFRTSPTDPNYRTENFHVYPTYSIQCDLMYRYARRWASGIGIDWFYGTYAQHIAKLDEMQGISMPHSPWSLGIAVKQETFYHQWSVGLNLGMYLHRQMGYNAQFNESRIYERLGIFYTFQKWRNLKLGINVKAHITKADLTEVNISRPINLVKKR